MQRLQGLGNWSEMAMNTDTQKDKFMTFPCMELCRGAGVFQFATEDIRGNFDDKSIDETTEEKRGPMHVKAL